MAFLQELEEGEAQPVQPWGDQLLRLLVEEGEVVVVVVVHWKH
jgi:hypothetical protein